jgi:hypothetical protein
MDNLFEELEIIVQHALLNQTTTEEMEEQLRNKLRAAEQLDSFIGQFILANIGDVVIFFQDDEEDDESYYDAAHTRPI